MTDDVLEFLIRGHQKVIGHYKLLLASNGLSSALRATIEERLKREEAAQKRLTDAEGQLVA